MLETELSPGQQRLAALKLVQWNDGISQGWLVTVRNVRWNTIEEGDANAHEQGDDDEAEAGAEGVDESEPVNPSLLRHEQQGGNMNVKT